MAIVFVLLSHLKGIEAQGGYIGVDLFFVLSGFLITSLLLEEQRESGDISLRAFYARRALRLLPALVVMLAVMVGLSTWKQSPEEAARIRSSALITLGYAANWFSAFKAYPSWELSPTWSLSGEEQFYLLWPLFLLGLLRAGTSTKRIAGIAALGMVLSAGWRAWLSRSTGSFDRVYFGLDTRSDGLLAGALAALLMSGGMLRATPAVCRLLNWAGHLTFLALLLYLKWGWVADPIVMEFGLFGLNVGMAVLILSLLFSPGPLLRVVFEFPPLVWLGKISYGLYLWHMVTFWMGGLLPVSSFEGRGPAWLWMLAGTVAVAAVSFYALERPLLKLKRRFERVRAPAPANR